MYRPAASRGALIYFLLSDLPKIHSFYKYSLESFIEVINRAINNITEGIEVKAKMYDIDADGNAIIPEVKKHRDQKDQQRKLKNQWKKLKKRRKKGKRKEAKEKSKKKRRKDKEKVRKKRKKRKKRKNQKKNLNQ